MRLLVILNAALEGGDINVFLLALQNVIQAQGGIAALAAKTKKVGLVYINLCLKMAIPILKMPMIFCLQWGMHLSVVLNEQRA